MSIYGGDKNKYETIKFISYWWSALLCSAQKYLDQVISIVVNGSISNENEILKHCGRRVKMWCIHTGNYEKVKQNPYHGVYDDDGNFIYPKLPQNIMHEMRKYLVNKILCGSETRKSRWGGN